MKLLWLWLLLGLAVPVVAQPARILLIRHGEKPEGRADPRLAAAGRERAQRWVGYFTASPLRTPTVLFAPQPTKGRRSVRPIETLEPLAKAMHQKVKTPFASEDYAKLAHQLLTDPELNGKIVAVCWVHHSLPQFAAALGVEPAPARWKESDYDGVYEVTFEDGKPRLAVTHAE